MLYETTYMLLFGNQISLNIVYKILMVKISLQNGFGHCCLPFVGA